MKNLFNEINEFTLSAIDSELYGDVSPYDDIHSLYELDNDCIVHPTLDMIHSLVK